MTVSIEGLQGWRRLKLDAVGSTNTEALDLAKNGDVGRVWVTAKEQLSGKARRGRGWVSKPGNLYASLLLIDPAQSEQLATLPLVVSLALHKALVLARPELSSRLRIKWPNDLLLDGKKLSGILLEAVKDPYDRLAVVIGCGINCEHFPDNPQYPATSLAAENIDLSPDELFTSLAHTLASELRIWASGAGFAIIRRDWLDRAQGVGQNIVARFPEAEMSGKFVDIDSDGFLLLEDDTGTNHRISAADIFFGNSSTMGA